MIRLEQVTLTYPGRPAPVLREVDLAVDDGELCLVVGQTGCGKSTLLGLLNGLVPHFTGGHLSGRVAVAGRDTRDHPPRELADVVGVVGQDPVAGFVTDTVEDELAFTMESLGVPAPVMRQRVEEVLDLLGLAGLRERSLLTLSAGQQQRVAIGAALTAHPSVLVLDEPTSALDPLAAEEVLAAVQRLVHDLGLTVVVAEHRLERVVQYADRVVWLPGAGRPPVAGDPAAVLAQASVVPPVVDLARLAGWQPVPLSVRDARRQAGPLRERLALTSRPAHPAAPAAPAPPPEPTGTTGATVVDARSLVVRFPGTVALRGLSLRVVAGEVVAVMGRNGAGKSTLLACLAGLRRPDAGTVVVAGAPVVGRPARDVVRRVGLVPHDPGDLLEADTVRAECVAADRDTGVPAGRTAGLLARLGPGIAPDRHPRDLSEGERLTLALAVVLAGSPALLLLDEPTRGLDYPAKERLGAVLREQAAAGRAVVLATHDVELAADVAGRTVVLADGEVVADAATADVVTASPGFAPQVAKILAPARWLTVAEVRDALTREAS